MRISAHVNFHVITYQLIRGEINQQLADLVIVFVFKLETRPGNALIKRQRPLVNQHALDGLQRLELHIGVLGQFAEVRSVSKIRIHFARRILEPSFKLIARPLNGVLNLFSRVRGHNQTNHHKMNIMRVHASKRDNVSPMSARKMTRLRT
jgi:hypothetical protein